eukprot:scaffold7857_cov471-Prasinococcus_capsulatus_cf.AAC.3
MPVSMGARIRCLATWPRRGERTDSTAYCPFGAVSSRVRAVTRLWLPAGQGSGAEWIGASPSESARRRRLRRR